MEKRRPHRMTDLPHAQNAATTANAMLGRRPRVSGFAPGGLDPRNENSASTEDGADVSYDNEEGRSMGGIDGSLVLADDEYEGGSAHRYSGAGPARVMNMTGPGMNPSGVS